MISLASSVSSRAEFNERQHLLQTIKKIRLEILVCTFYHPEHYLSYLRLVQI